MEWARRGGLKGGKGGEWVVEYRRARGYEAFLFLVAGRYTFLLYVEAGVYKSGCRV